MSSLRPSAIPVADFPTANAPETASPARGRALAVEEVVDLWQVEQAEVSNDGCRVVVVVGEPRDVGDPPGSVDTSLWMVDLNDAGAPVCVVAAQGIHPGSPTWSPDGTTIAFLADYEMASPQDPDRGWQGRRIHLCECPSGGELVPEIALRHLPHRGGNITALAWSPDGTKIAFLAADIATDEEEQRHRAGYDHIVAGAPTAPTHLWKADVADGRTVRMSPPEWDIRAMAWSPDGQKFAVITSADVPRLGQLAILDHTGGSGPLVQENASLPGSRLRIHGWSPDGRFVVFARALYADGVGHALALAAVDGTGTRTLLEDYPGTPMGALWPPDSSRLLVQAMESCRSTLLVVDPEAGTYEKVGEFAAEYPTMSSSRDGRHIIYVADTPRAPADVWHLHRGAEPRQVTTFNPQIEGLQLGAVTEISWPSTRDDTQIRGLLVTPPDYDPGKQYPTVVQVHGGPHFHWGAGWQASWHDWAQLLATRGYVVFLPNPRGSTGRGWPYARAILGDLGGVDYRDIIDGVDALVERKVADPDRLGIGGWSYGGYMTTWTITQTRRFRAAIVGAGISDVLSHAGVPGTGPNWTSSYFPDHQHARQSAYRDRSPITHLHQVTTPTLVMHGQVDRKISANQAWQTYNGLRSLEIECSLVLYPREGHGIHERAHQIDFINRVINWYDHYLAP